MVSQPLLHPPLWWSIGGQRVEEGWTMGGECLGYARILSEFSMLYRRVKEKWMKSGKTAF